MFTEVLLCFIIIVIAGVYYVVTYFVYPHREDLQVPFIPGRLPLIGNAWQLNISRPHIALSEWSKKHGSVFRMQLYNEEILVLNDYVSIYEALVVNGAAVSGRPPMYRTAQNERNQHSIVWQTYTSKLVFLRKEVHKCLKMYGHGLEHLEDKCKVGIQKLLQNFKNTENVPVNPQPVIYDSVCNIMLDLILGSATDSNFERVNSMNIVFNDIFGSGSSRKLDFLPWMRYIASSSQQKLTDALRLRDDIWENDVKPQLMSTNNQNGGVIRRLLNLIGDPNYKEFNVTENTAKEVFTNLVLAGTDTTSTALTSLLLIFLHYPKIQDKMFREISAFIDDETPPMLYHRSSLPYCEAVLLELLRYISHVPLAVPHYTMEDTVICGKHVPSGLTVYINLWALHHDDNFWRSPWDFDPSRFLDDHGRLLAPGSATRRRLMVFGAGRRVCLGETLAKNRLFLLVTSLVQKMEFTPVDPSNLPSCDPRTFEMGLVLHPKPFTLTVKSRCVSQS